MYIYTYRSTFVRCCPFISCSASSNIYMVLRGAPCLSHRCCAMRMDGWNDIRIIPVDIVEDDDARTHIHTHTHILNEIIPNHPRCVAYDRCTNVLLVPHFSHILFRPGPLSLLVFGTCVPVDGRCWPLLAIASIQRQVTIPFRDTQRASFTQMVSIWTRYMYKYENLVCIFFLSFLFASCSCLVAAFGRSATFGTFGTFGMGSYRANGSLFDFPIT